MSNEERQETLSGYISLRIDVEAIRRIKEIARFEDRNDSEIYRRAISEWLRLHDRRPQGKDSKPRRGTAKP